MLTRDLEGEAAKRKPAGAGINGGVELGKQAEALG
jgi:hypothetical protein